MSKKKVLICDDSQQIRTQWKQELDKLRSVQSSFTVECVEERKFVEAVSDLERRRREARGRTPPDPKWGDNIFDKVSVLIIDYDLFRFNKENYLTGEGVGYLARCYSRCGVIVALNQYREVDFDLTLRGHPESFADLNMGSGQLANPGLWGDYRDGFRPWYWPLLSQAATAFDKRVEDLLDGNLDEPILEFLGFPGEVVETLPRSTSEFLGSRENPEKTTFRNFVLRSTKAVRGKDKLLDDESIARVAAGRLAKWLERLVLTGQDILVDAPHLVSRFPSLLTGSRSRRDTWDKTASFAGISNLGIRYQGIQEFRFQKQEWLSRPAWFWKRLSNFDKIEEVANPWSTDKSNLVFCEDVSCFLPREATREFVADLPSPFVRRFVVDIKSEGGLKYADRLQGINYEPRVRFSL